MKAAVPTIKRKYEPSSPFVEAALVILDRSQAKFENFGTMEEKIARVISKEQWKHDARAMFEHGAVTKAYLKETSHGHGLPTHVEFHIEFKAITRQWKSVMVDVRPSVVISIESEDELRKTANKIRDDRKEHRALTRAARITDMSEGGKGL